MAQTDVDNSIRWFSDQIKEGQDLASLLKPSIMKISALTRETKVFGLLLHSDKVMKRGRFDLCLKGDSLASQNYAFYKTAGDANAGQAVLEALQGTNNHHIFPIIHQLYINRRTHPLVDLEVPPPETHTPIYQNEFQFLDELGEGSYGRVIKVKCKRTKTDFALKLINLFGRESNDKRIAKEAHILENLNSLTEDPRRQHVLQIVKSWKTTEMNSFDFPLIKPKSLRGLFFIQMEFCQQSLQEWMEDGSHEMKLDEAKYYFAQVVEGVTFLHDQNILHRDLKPSNILLKEERDGEMCNKIAKIGDFGASRVRLSGAKSTLTRGVGTEFYMSPEQRTNDPNYSDRTDIYSLGVILLVLHRPWEECGEDSEDEMRKDLIEKYCEEFGGTESHTLPKRIRDEFREEATMMEKMLTKSLNKRPKAQDVYEWCRGWLLTSIEGEI